MVEDDPLATRYSAAAEADGITDELTAVGLTEPKEIGRGGFGVVYRCSQITLDRTVAVKVLTADLDEENLNRFMREQRAMGRLSSHPNIVTVLEVGTTAGGRPFIVMQYDPGGTLESLIRKQGPVDWDTGLRIGVRIAGALETAHRAGILHRDIKPANILFTEYGDVQLTDFGIARIAGGFETRTGLIAGTPAFTAPEVLSGATPTVTSDVYGLGATLFCALTGHVAFERRQGESIVAQFLRITSEPVPKLGNVDIPDEVSAAIGRAMAKDPADRPASAGEFSAELRETGRQLGVGMDEMPVRTHAADEARHDEAGSVGSITGQHPSGHHHRSGLTSPPTLSTKFRPPRRPRRRQVPRSRLIDALRAGGDRLLTLIHAPAGYGKTSLAAQWAEELAADGVKIAWLTVDDNDNNPVWFLTNLVRSVERVNPNVTEGLEGVLEERGDDAEQYVLTSLINGIDQCDESMTMFLDDWHRVTAAPVIDTLDFLLDNAGDNLQIVIVSRSRSGVPISRLQVRDELTEIDARALCFDVEETRTLLTDGTGVELQDDEVADLCHATGGWAAGLQLASLSLRRTGSAAQVIGQISGGEHDIADFLAENVLSVLEPEMLQFLLTTSICERICGSLASELSGESRGQAMLEEAEERDLFLHRIDGKGRWFRYQNLFGEFLRRRLDRDHPDLVIPLQQKASKWFAEHRMLVEAVDHALAAGDTERAVGLVATDGLTLLENSQTATLLGLVDKLPYASVASSPELQLALGRANTILHRMDAAHVALDRAEELLKTQHGGEVGYLRAIAGVWEGALRAHEDRLDGADDLVRDCLATPDAFPPFVVSTAANVAMISALYRFDFDAVFRWQKFAEPYSRQAGGPYAVRYGYLAAGVAAFEQLDLTHAEQCFRAAHQVESRAAARLQSGSPWLAGVLLAGVLYERGETAEAQRLLDESSSPSGEEGTVDIMASRVTLGARLAVLRGDRTTGAELLDDGADVADRRSIPRLLANVENVRALLGLPTRRALRPPVEFAQRRRATDGPANGVDEIIAQLREDTAIHLLVVDGRHELACRWAQEWVDHLQDSGRNRALLSAQRTLAECLCAAGRLPEAKCILGVVLARCAELDMVRFPLDGGGPLIPLIAKVRDDQENGKSDIGVPGLPIEFLNRILR